MIRIGTKCRRILFYIRGDQRFLFLQQRFKAAAVKVIGKEGRKERVILCKERILFHELMIQRALSHDAALCRRIDRIVDQHVWISDRVAHAQRIGAKSQIIIPWQHPQPAFFFIQDVIVPGMAQIAVPVHHEHLYDEITQHFIGVDRRRHLAL